MFSALSKFTNKYRIAITVVWLAAAVIMFLFYPKISEVGVTDESQFLPQDTQSAAAARIIDQKFPSTVQAAASTGIIVVYHDTGLSEEDYADAMAIRDWLLSDSAPDAVEGVTSVFDNEALAASLISADGTTMLMPVSFSVSPLSDAGASLMV